MQIFKRDRFMRLFLALFLILALFLTSCKEESGSSGQTGDTRSFQQIWELFESQMKAKQAKINFRFNPSAQAEEIQVLEKVVGQKFTADMLNLYNLGNGQAEDGSELFRGFTLVSTSEAAKTWQLMENNHKDKTLPMMNKGPVKKDFWNSKWIPIGADAGGNLLCVDFDPASGGAVGQLVAVYLDDVERSVVAKSIRDYFAKTSAGLRSGQMAFDEFGTGPWTKEELKKMQEDQ